MEREKFKQTLEKYDGLFNPFITKSGELDSARVSIDIPKEVHQRLKNATVDKGFFQRALSMFIFCLDDFCESRQLMYYNPLETKEFYEFIRSRCTLIEPVGTGHSKNDNRGVKKTSSGTKKRGRKRAVTKSVNRKTKESKVRDKSKETTK